MARLAVFFKEAPRTAAVQRYGTPAAIEHLVFKNLRECSPYFDAFIPEKDQAFLESAYRRYFALHQPLFKKRVREKRIIDGHGDLRCENICLTEPVTVFDCVEFEPAFRRGDIANDLAFLLMDFEVRKRADLARKALEVFLAKGDDSTLKDVLPFYKCHRSLVRGKVKVLEWLEEPRTPRGKRARALAQRHFRWAVQYARQFSPPFLIGVGGLVGSGKSTLAGRLAARLGAVLLQTDEIRRREFGASRKLKTNFDGGMYLPRVSRQVYRRLLRRAETCLRRGSSVVCDGNFPKNEFRLALRGAAAREAVPFLFLECTAPSRIVMRRLVRRYRSDPSQVKPEYYALLRKRYEPVEDLPPKEHIRLLTSRSPEVSFQAALQRVSVSFG
jgi:hypothetical protein